MELLLNLIWIILTVVALCAFARSRRLASEISPSRSFKALLALSCILVLLFPIISASDDLHPVQAAVEDASKRVQLVLAVGSTARNTTPTIAILFIAFAMYLWFALVASWRRRLCPVRMRRRDAERITAHGRAPPLSLADFCRIVR